MAALTGVIGMDPMREILLGSVFFSSIGVVGNQLIKRVRKSPWPQ